MNKISLKKRWEDKLFKSRTKKLKEKRKVDVVAENKNDLRKKDDEFKASNISYWIFLLSLLI